jgi:FMN phosphatase YigB (HAD superfamily)
LHPSVTEKLGEVFSRDRSTAHEWMKGLHSSDDIISEMDIQTPKQYRSDFLRRRLDEDCRNMTVNVELFKVLQEFRDRAHVVIATDNMDCFVDAFDSIRSTRRSQSTESATTFAHWAAICDDIICSSDVGTLKSEDPRGFFGTYLEACGLSFVDALLIDDRADNCEAFVSEGGTAVRWKMQSNHIDEVIHVLRPWLMKQPTRVRSHSAAEVGPFAPIIDDQLAVIVTTGATVQAPSAHDHPSGQQVQLSLL